MFQLKNFIRDRKVRIALVGCGRISERHLDALKKNAPIAELVAVCDSDGRAVEKAASQFSQVEIYQDYSHLLERTSADLVVLATPSGLHAEQTIRAAQTKRHVMTEKPMATRWQDGLKMVQVCDNEGVALYVVKQNRYNPTIQLLKHAIEMGRFGRIFLATTNVFWCRPQSYYSSAPWRGTWEFDGGAIMNQASHYIDLLDWLVGPIESVQAITGTLARRIEVEDSAVVNFKWRNGALGSANITMLTYNKNLEGSLTILGERGTVRLGGLALNQVEHWEFEHAHEDDLKVKDSAYNPQSVYGNGHSRVYENICASLKGEAQPLTDGRGGLRSLEVMIASYVSARDGRRVSLPLEI